MASDKCKGYDHKFWYSLIKAVAAEDMKQVDNLIDDAGKNPTGRCFDGYDEGFWTPLMRAFEEGDEVRFEELISVGADVNKGNVETEDYPITIAAENGREEMFFRLVELGAKLDINEYCCPMCSMWYGFRPADLFVYAAGAGSVRIARYLWFMGVRPWSETRSMNNAGRKVKEIVSNEFLSKIFLKRELASKRVSDGIFYILGWDTIRTCREIGWTHYNGFWPIAVRLNGEVRVCDGGRILTAKACYVLRLWELARRACATKGLDADAQSKWVAMGRGLWRISYGKNCLHDDWDLFVATMREEMKRIVDHGDLVVHVGVNEPLPGPYYGKDGGFADFVIPDLPGKGVGDWSKEAVEALNGDLVGISFRWSEICDAVTTLTDMQVAFLRADEMPKPTDADKAFFDACDRMDVSAMEDALSQGADVYAVDSGDSAAVKIADSVMFSCYAKDSVPRAEGLAIAKRAFQCVLDHGGDLDFSGLGMDCALNASINGSSELVGLLLELGSDPNAPSWFACGELNDTALAHAYVDWDICPIEDVDYPAMIRLLYRYGGMCCLPSMLDSRDYLNDVESEDGTVVLRESFYHGVKPRDRPLLQAVHRGYEYIAILAARWGANPAIRDEHGRSLVRVFIEDHTTFCPNKTECSQRSIANYMLFLLNGLRVPVDLDEASAIAESCAASATANVLMRLSCGCKTKTSSSLDNLAVVVMATLKSREMIK